LHKLTRLTNGVKCAKSNTAAKLVLLNCGRGSLTIEKINKKGGKSSKEFLGE